MSTLNNPQRLAGASMAVVAISAFLPWVSILGFSKAGIEGDGAITLVCALVGLAALAFHAGLGGRLGRKAMLIVSAIAGAVTLLIALADMNGAAAIGLYLTLFAGLAWVAAVIWDVRLGRTSAREPA
jgi:hypothetical protein